MSGNVGLLLSLVCLFVCLFVFSFIRFVCLFICLFVPFRSFKILVYIYSIVFVIYI